MADNNERKPKAARVTPPDALALPHIVEAIAMCLNNQADLMSYLHAVPRSLWTPALTAFLDCATAMPSWVIADWPCTGLRMRLRDMDLPPSVLTLLAATLPLRPRIELEFAARNAAPLASLVAVLGPALSSVILFFYSERMVRGGGRAISNLLLQRCPRLRHVAISVIYYSADDAAELNDLLAVVAHPHVNDLSIDLWSVTIAPPRLGHRLAAWLSTAPATKLTLTHVGQMDDDAMMAFCDALQGNTTLQELIVYDVRSLGGFHGRTLPVSLKTLEWDASPQSDYVVDAATLTDFATAVGPTQLERLSCSVFGQLATCPAAAPMLAQLQSLAVSGSNDVMEALIAGLSSVPALTSLELRGGNLSTFLELLMKTLATTCMHLETLSICSYLLTRREVVAVLSGTLDLPRLTSLSMAIRLSPMLDVLPELVAAGRHLRTLQLETMAHYEKPGAVDEGMRALCRALALIQNVPFVVDYLPKDTDGFVVDALGPRADRGSRCRLSFR